MLAEAPGAVPYFPISSENDIDLAVWHGKMDGTGHAMQMERPDAANEVALRELPYVKVFRV